MSSKIFFQILLPQIFLLLTHMFRIYCRLDNSIVALSRIYVRYYIEAKPTPRTDSKLRDWGVAHKGTLVLSKFFHSVIPPIVV